MRCPTLLHVGLSAMAFLLASCRSMRVRPDVPAAIPADLSAAYSAEDTGRIAPPGHRWWDDFGSPELSALVNRAFAGNLSLAQASARLRQADALAIKARAAQLPEIAGGAAASVTRTKIDGFGRNTTENYAVGPSAAYEVDLWGRIDATVRASELRARTAQADVETVALLLSAEIVNRWLLLLRNETRLSLLQSQLETNRKALDLLEFRRRRGLSAAIDVLQQRQVLAGTESLIPTVALDVALLKHQLAILTGMPPTTESGLLEPSPELPPLPPTPALGVPADLLLNRPDVRAAFLRLRTEEWSLAAAKADRLPALRLTGAASYRDDEDLNGLFDNWIANLAASLSVPLLDGGRRKAEVERVRALADERLAAYREAVLGALADVEDALVRERHTAELLVRLERQLQFARETFSESEQRYRKGLSDYLPVLQSIVSVQSLEREVINARQAVLASRVGLYRALGGTWTAEAADLGQSKDGALPPSGRQE